MLAYLRYMLLPRPEAPVPIEVVSQSGRSLAFRSSKKLEVGQVRVSAKSRKKSVSFLVDVFLADQVCGLYEGHIVVDSRASSSKEPQHTPNETGVFAEITESFVSGCVAHSARPVAQGMVLKIELDDESAQGEERFAEVLWCRKWGNSRYQVRLDYLQNFSLEDAKSRGSYMEFEDFTLSHC